MAVYTALLDANVIYSIPVTDLVLELASTGLFRARWSDDIHAEWMRNVKKDLTHLSDQQIEKRRDAMNSAIPQALVTGYHSIIECLDLPDKDDRHVLAAAIVGRADVIVTSNLKDFPPDKLRDYGIEAQHPDDFLNHQRTLNEPCFLQCVKAIRERLSKPKYSAEEYIAHLEKCGLAVVAAELKNIKGLI